MTSTADSTAAFFAKKKKKGFKGFNANKIDAASVSSTMHVDAPAVSDPTSSLASTLASTSLPSSADPDDAAKNNEATEQWDDEALAAATARKAAAATTTGGGGGTTTQTAELLDMKAIDTKRREQDDIAERMRVEETKAALAAAREGMEREAQRLKESEEQKTAAAAEGASVKPRFGAAAAAASSSESGGGGKWVPPHLRAGGAGLTRSRPSSTPQKLDTKDENLFPDLASADAILEQQQKKQDQAAFKVPKKTPVGGGATWGSRPPSLAKPAAKPTPPSEEKAAPSVQPTEEPKAAPSKPAANVSATKPTKAVLSSAGTGEKKKRKKKDLSTFKPSS